MKKVIAWVLTLAMVAAVSVGATFAYLTDTDEDVNVMTVGNVKIDQLEYERIDDETGNEDAKVQEFHDNKPLYPAVTDEDFAYVPGDTNVDWTQIGKDGYSSEIWDPSKINNEIDKMVFVKNKGTYDAYVRSVIAFEAAADWTFADFQQKIHLNANEENWTWDWIETPVSIGEGTYFVAVVTYNERLAPGALTEISLSQIALDSAATNADVEALGDTYNVLVKTQAIQADGFENAVMALNDGFGLITAEENIPFETDQPAKGIDMLNALHYLNGDGTTKITDKVTNVVFGLNKNHANIVDNYDGILVTEEQDVPVHVYYVPNGSNYDIYLLANDVIYTPKDSGALFGRMTALKSVDTANMDTGRTENMKEMFRQCTALTTMDMSNWDTSNATDMNSMFRDCDSLAALPISSWNVEKVTSFYAFAYSCANLQSADISGWNAASAQTMGWIFSQNTALKDVDVTGLKTPVLENIQSAFAGNRAMANLVGEETLSFPKVTVATWMFENCAALPEIVVTSWDLSSLQNASGMFSGCSSMTSLTGSETMNMASVTNMSYMFQSCGSLPYLDVTGWNTENCVNMDRTFFNCTSLKTLEGSESLDTGKVTTFYATFYNNPKLEDLDVSTWDTGSVTDMSQMFRGDVNLRSLDVSNWDVSSVTTTRAMFSSFNQNKGDMKLEAIDLSKWRPTVLTDIAHMFYGCGQLKKVDMSGWDVTTLQDMTHMFADCYKLEEVYFTGWNTTSLGNMDAIFNNCEAMKSVDMSMFDTSNVYYFSQMFEACYSLEEVIGLENWDTSYGDNFSEMFSGCRNLKQLDLSSFDTRNADHLKEGDWVFLRFLSGCTGLEKITFGPYFDFDGVGCAAGYKFVMPAATGVEGWDGKWYNAETGVGYLPSEVPAMTAATYLAVNPNATEAP